MRWILPFLRFETDRDVQEFRLSERYSPGSRTVLWSELCFTSHFYNLYRYHYQRQWVSESGILNCKTYIPNHYRYDNPYSHAIYRTNDWVYFPHLSTIFLHRPNNIVFSTPLLICILSFQHFFISYWYILCIDFIANVFLNIKVWRLP